jgi:hypothetical protein
MSTSNSRRARAVSFAVVALLAWSSAAGAQGMREQMTASDLGGVMVTVYVPADNADLDTRAQTMLRTRMGSIVSTAGLSALGVVTPFVMYPEVTVVDAVTSSGGLQNVVTVRLEASFVVKQYDTHALVHQWSTTLVGTGNDRAAAIAQALGSLRPGDAGPRDFGKAIEQRVVSYYETNCGSIRSQANADVAAGGPRARGAIASLLAVPRAARTCHEQAAADAERHIVSVEREHCQQHIASARAKRVAQDDAAAAEELVHISGNTSCRADADRLMADLEKSAREKQNQRALVSLQAVRTKQETGVRIGSKEGMKQNAANTAVEFFNSRESRSIKLDIMRD